MKILHCRMIVSRPRSRMLFWVVGLGAAMLCAGAGCHSTPQKQAPTNPWVRTEKKTDKAAGGGSLFSSKDDSKKPQTPSQWISQPRVGGSASYSSTQ